MQLSHDVLSGLTFGQRTDIEVAPDDRRTAPRKPLLGRATVSAPQCRRASKTVVMLRDVSENGIGFLCETAIQPGDEVVVHLAQRGDDGPLRARCVVRRCEQGGTGGVHYIVGAIFIELLDNGGASQN